ncbi:MULTISPECIES: electron transport complex subunit RsxC [Shewanella]|uniref:electron transport complex subunit RsxC n=1 Tax=Shewanella TaxID=22 RepID=UPI000C3E22C1|nr:MULTISPECIES: electron transport complex subunit RsxC [Shewanella]NCQ45975.1 electron transport complex subunit RsxC [Shewanella frigidimarina]NCO70433.1 electron transport complex subunit RsxC [Shewanella vesiculosa]NCP36495.1 electron transport complex subunit RsxC [Shewanella vesiculosa]NCP69776.1 electron transport complex subunit RsxC [Shewanella vesiculosa]NCP75480.1 electron transport complex subunit RsxC [Shewanella vesiculosa]
MLTLLEQLDKGHLWRSPGGIHPPELKTLSNQSVISSLPLPSRFVVPVPLVGQLATMSVKVGDHVLKGQALTEGAGFTYLPVHAPTSGVVVAIEQHNSNHASTLPVLSCIIEADGQDTWCELIPNQLEQLSKSAILDKIKQAGIAGMGGAAFPSHVKLNPASEIDLVIINGVECEPYISADDRLMRDYSDEILTGISIIHHLLNPQRIVIAIEDNKPEAAKAMQAAITRSTLPNDIIRVTVIPTKYPSGGEKQLIQIITGKEVPSGAIPAQLGIVMHNVGTAYAIQEAVLQGKPLIERVVTFTGERVGKPGNYWLRIGTTVADALNQVNFAPDNGQKVIVGGPMMGYALADLDVPILKGTNCLLTPSQAEIAPDADEKACIRCGECAVACPALLLPQQLFWHAKAEEYDKAASFNLKDCIECGCCSYVCPSDIPLVEYYRVAKSALKNTAEEKLQAERAKQRFEVRLQRLEDEKTAREEKSKQAAAKRQANMKSSDKDAVAAAMARIAAKKAQTADATKDSVTTDTNITDAPSVAVDSPDAKKTAVSAAIERAKAKKAAIAAQSLADKQADVTEATADHSADNIDDKKAKIAAAVARAKAKKAGLANESAATDNSATSSSAVTAEAINNPSATDSSINAAPVDDKKAKIAAAVARAKAKKAALANESAATDNPAESDSAVTAEAINSPSATDSSINVAPVDDKKAKIAAAVAKAKAKKAALANESAATDNPAEPSSAVAAEAINSPSATDSSINAAPVDDKKAKIAAAVAKAKAKKAALANELTQTDESAVSSTVVNQAIKTASDVDMTNSEAPIDDKKAKIAAAVAKAKAKKLANSAKQEE